MEIIAIVILVAVVAFVVVRRRARNRERL